MKLIKTLNRKILINTILSLKNLIEDLCTENKDLKETNQKLKDEVNRLKGEKGKPDIKPKVDEFCDGENSSDDEKETKKKKKWNKSKKKHKIKITRREKVKIDKKNLPKDAEYKGTRSIIIQDIKIETDNIEFAIERYHSKSEKRSIEAELPEKYKGSEFGPGIHSLILTLHYQCRMPHKLLHSVLSGMGVIISEGEISNIINKDRVMFSQENEKARKAGLEKQEYQQIDDTGARIKGQNGYTIVTCNDYFTLYQTVLTKDRLSALKALSGGRELEYVINNFTISYLKEKLPPKAIWKKMDKLKSEKIYSLQELEDEILNHPEVELYGTYAKRYIKEACAIGAYRAGLLDVPVNKLICDDAPQFKGIMEYLQLCWVHEGRHYKKLDPYIDEHRAILEDFLDKFWDYYEMLKAYKKNPTAKFKKELYGKFDEVFSANTDYFALNRIIKKTQKKKEQLLVVLKFPTLPLHNNACELDTREKVVQRKIRNCYRSFNGAKSSDVFLSLMAICRKNSLSFFEYLKDRIYNISQIPSLDIIIKTSP